MPEPVETQVREIVDTLRSFGVAALQAVIVIGAARLLQGIVRRRVTRRLENSDVSESGRTSILLIANIVVAVVAGTVLLALWGVTWSGIITAISVGTLGILLGIQDVLKSLIGGLFLIVERPYAVGDRVQFRDVSGHVIAIELRTTILRSDTGHRVVSPNSVVFTDSITNLSRKRYIKTSVIISGLPPDTVAVKQAVEAAFSGVDGIEGTPTVRFRASRPDITSAVKRDSHGESASPRRISRSAEARVTWMSGGEPEIEETIIARIRERFPGATIRSNQS